MYSLFSLTVYWRDKSTLSNKTKKMLIWVLNETSLLRIRVFREIVHFLFYLGKAKKAHIGHILPTSFQVGFLSTNILVAT